MGEPSEPRLPEAPEPPGGGESDLNHALANGFLTMVDKLSDALDKQAEVQRYKIDADLRKAELQEPRLRQREETLRIREKTIRIASVLGIAGTLALVAFMIARHQTELLPNLTGMGAMIWMLIRYTPSRQ